MTDFDKTIDNIKKFKLPKSKIVYRSPFNRDQLLQSMNLTDVTDVPITHVPITHVPITQVLVPRLNLSSISTNNNYHMYNSMEYHDGPIIDGINIQALYTNIREFDLGSIVTIDRLNNVLFIDNHRDTLSDLCWLSTINYISGLVSLNDIFVNDINDVSNIVPTYGSSLTSVTPITIRSHDEISSAINQLMLNYTYRPNDRNYIVIDQMRHNLQNLSVFRILTTNNQNNQIGHMVRTKSEIRLRDMFRSSFNFIFLNPFSINNLDMEYIHETYFPIIPSYEVFEALINELKDKHEMLVFDRGNTGLSLYDRLYKYKF